MTFSPNPETMTTEQEERIVCLRGRFARDGARLKGDAFAEDVFLALEALDATRASLAAAEAKLEPTKWGHVRSAIDEMRSDERVIEDATAKRIAEWMRGEYPKGMRAFVSSVAHNAADAIERGDWRPK